MSFLERAIRRGVSNAVGKAVGNAVEKAVEPHATNLANRTAAKIDAAAQNTHTCSASGLEAAMANLERSAQNYATEAAKNMKVCPKCNKPTAADKKFCPECGEKLPEQTLAQDAVCQCCGKQNSIGTKFCSECGSKLPTALRQEQEQAERNAAVMAQWDEMLPQYPKWTCGGDDISIDSYGEDGFSFDARFRNNPSAAQRAVEQYRQILLADGFRQTGQNPCITQLFKRIDGVVYNVDTEHCFEGDPDCATIGFCIREPYGGFDYVKPEPKKKTGWKDLFGF